MTETHVEDILSGKDKARADLVISLATKIRRVRESDPNYVRKARKPRAPAAEANGNGEARHSEQFSA